MLTFENDIYNVVSLVEDIVYDFVAEKGKDIRIRFVKNSFPMRTADASDTPFASNPTQDQNITYNGELISSLGLTEPEIAACILHEIGHITIGPQESITDTEAVEKEIKCDQYASLYGFGMSLMTALLKMSELIEPNALRLRLESLAQQSVVYRPEWTCGRYNASKRCAIMYNLVAGMSYFFEEESAEFIGILLSKKRWQMVNTHSLSQELNADIISTTAFLSQLIEIGLVSTRHYCNKDIQQYREEMLLQRKMSHLSGEQKQGNHTDDAFERSEAEELYLEKSGICGAVMFEMTYRCSEKCIHCYNPGASRNENEIANRGRESNELHFEDYVAIIDDLYDNGLFKVCLSGGDPFSKSCVWQVIEYLYEKDIAFDIFTNGLSLVGKEDQLAKYYPRTVGLSVYSMLPNVHDSITRVSGSLERTTKVARKLSELSIPEYIKCCVMKSNMGSYSTVYAFANEIGATVQVDMNVSNSIDGDRCVSCYLKPSESDYKVLLLDPKAIMYVGLDNISPAAVEEAKDIRICKAGIRSFCVSPTGELMPCCALHLILGNLKKSSISEIVNESPAYSKWISLRLSDFQKCTSCEDIDFCPLCPGFNYSENHDVLVPSHDNCDIARFRHNVYRDLHVGIQSDSQIYDSPCPPELHRVN